MPVRGLEVLAIGLVAGVAVERALAVTGAGAVMRAVSQDPGAAALLGVPCERVVLAAFALAGALAGLAGVLIAPDAALGPDDGALLGLKGIAAALIGGLVSLRLALLGGLALGVLEAFVVAWEPLGGALGRRDPAGAARRCWRRGGDDRPRASTSTCSRRRSGSSRGRVRGDARARAERVPRAGRGRGAAARARRAARSAAPCCWPCSAARSPARCWARSSPGPSAARVALATWGLAWLATTALLAFPELSGGTQGLTRPALDRVETYFGVALTLTPTRARGARR